MESTAALTQRFIRTIDGFDRRRNRHEHFSDFLELACCAVRKPTMPPGPEADAIEDRYMSIVGRHRPDDIRAMPELLVILHLAVAEGGCDFLGGVAGELGALDARSGQFFTPFHVSRMMAELALQGVSTTIEARGFVTLEEPACGAGSMVIAADVIAAAGHDPMLSLYVEATDLSTLAFHMAYLQIAARGIPALVRRADSLTLEQFDRAYTPAMMPFLARHGDAFMAWQVKSRRRMAERQAVTRKGEQLVLI